MKTALLLITLVLGCKGSPSDAALGDSAEQHESYSLGYQLGTSLKNQHTTIQLEEYVAGLRDALASTPAKVSETEMQAAVKGLRDRAVEAQQGRLREQATSNRSSGAAFLAQNKRHDGVTTLPSGLQYRVLAEGKGARPTEASKVSVSYTTKLVDGKQLSSSSGKPFTVDLQRVIPAWREAIPLMKEGAKWELVVPPQLAYGARGTRGIGPESTLVFEVELLHANAEKRVN